MKYKASQIIKRALNLADIANTDFLTHKELTDYVNDSWWRVYNWIINKGVKQFVREVSLQNCSSNGTWTEYVLPYDLYKIIEIKNPFSGSILTRAAASSGINSGTYDVVNNKLRLYGTANQHLVMTYASVPKRITYPVAKSDIENYNILASAGDSAIVRSSGTYAIVNLRTNETIAELDWLSNFNDITLGNGHILVDLTMRSFSGELLGTFDSHNFIYDNNYNIYAMSNGSYVLGNKTYDSDTLTVWDGIPIKYNDGVLTYGDEEYDILIYEGESLFPIEEDGGPTFVFSKDDKYYTMTIHYEGYVTEDELTFENPQIEGLLKTGIITSNGTYSAIESAIPDTLFNFPNDLYVTLIAVDLAVRFAIKMNADHAGLDSLYIATQQDFMNSIDQSGSYTRIKNIYR